jgi:hypothetical protein
MRWRSSVKVTLKGGGIMESDEFEEDVCIASNYYN